MSNKSALLARTFGLVAALGLASCAGAVSDRSLRLEVLVNGATLAEHHARGNTYIEAERGHEYSLRITNLEPVRVAVAVSVDGRNVIDAQRTSAASARKWILEPWQSVVLDGWQTSDQTASRFFFTTEARSYAAWLGDASQAGVIEAVAYRERSYAPPPAITHRTQPPWYERDRDARRNGHRDSAVHEGEAAGSAGPGAAPMPSARAEAQSPSAAKMRKRESADTAQPSAELAATGIGRDVGHEVVRINFEHESVPCGSVRVRYGFHDELVKLGVLPRYVPPRDAIARREDASGFAGYCPRPR